MILRGGGGPSFLQVRAVRAGKSVVSQARVPPSKHATVTVQYRLNLSYQHPPYQLQYSTISLS